VSRARAIVLKHGWNATSYQIVNPGIAHWFSTGGDAVVGFVRYSGYRIVAGAPVCSVERIESIVEEFESESKSSHERVCYFGAEGRLESALSKRSTHSMALLGAQPAWNPAHFDAIVKSHSSLRAQLNRAKNKGVSIVEYTPREAMNSPDLQNVLASWLKHRGLPPLHFLVEPETLNRLDDRRIFVARLSDPYSVAAFAVLSPIPARNGWLVEQFPRLPRAPNGTIELLLTTAVNAIAESGATYVTLGLAPLARRSEAVANESRLLQTALSFASSHGRRFYNFKGLETFKSKFRPEVWENVYAIENSSRFSMRALYAIAGAFAQRSPVRLVLSALLKPLSARPKLKR
jgi:phosphatidylglycerol lysyltransferase